MSKLFDKNRHSSIASEFIFDLCLYKYDNYYVVKVRNGAGYRENKAR